ncbi:hypothetical protein SpCBS45565_g05687 [Spizellomyces sp. 'palustris']|nr:hypothetical protein SpCBS45565_g05687 [Spizellomyces sp. 'palustris']
MTHRTLLMASAVAAFSSLSAYAQTVTPATGGAFEVVSQNTGVSAVHMALLPNDKLLLSERFHEIPSDWRRFNQDGTPNLAWNGDLAQALWAESSPIYQPNKNLGDFFTDACEFDVTNNKFEMKNYAFDTQQGYSFCNGASQLADGTILIAGGDQKWNMPFKGKNYTSDGRRDVRVYNNGILTKVGEMPLDTRANKTGGDYSGRWYPTVITLPDERAMILGGHKVYFKPTDPEVNNPTYEIFPAPTPKNLTAPVNVNVLAATFPINMYPISYVLPQSGQIFTLAGNRSATINYANGGETPGPSLPEDNVYPRSFPFAGTNWMNPLTKANGYKATVWVCGGVNRTATPDGWDNANFTRHWFDNCSNCDGTARCYHTNPEDSGAAWVPEDMPLGRSQPQAINLADGKVGIFGGSGIGHQGGDAGVGYMARNPVNKAVLFDPSQPVGNAKRWVVGAEATVPRLYHGTSVLRTDGSVVFAGSDEQNYSGDNQRRTDPYELRAEVYKPPYFYIPDRLSLDLGSVATKAGYGQSILVPLTTPAGAKIAAVHFIRYGTSTHTLNIDQRLVELEILKWGKDKVLVKTPATANIAPPGNWMLFAVDNRGAPVVQAATINLRTVNAAADATWNEADTVTPEAKPSGKDASSGAMGVKGVLWAVVSAVVGGVVAFW